MSGWTAPSQDPEAWSFLRVVAFALTLVIPGRCTISDNARKIPYDEKKGSGQEGATNERKGLPLKKFKSTHLLTDWPWPPGTAELPPGRAYVNDFDQWNGAELLLKESYAGEKPVALTVIHPELQRQNIDAATVDEVGGFVDNKNGTGTITIGWTEHNPPKPKGAGGGVADSPDKKTAADRDIEAELEEMDRLNKEYEDL